MPDPKRPQSYYAGQYGISLPTIKRLWKDKRVPWDNPDAMGDILAAKGDKREQLLVDHAARTSGEAPPHPDGEQPEEDLSMGLPTDFGHGIGLRREVEALEQACQAARRMFQKADSAGNHKVGALAMSRWIELGGQLRQVAKDTPKVLKDTSTTLDKAEVKSKLTRGLIEFAAVLRRAGSRLQDKFADKIDPHVFKAALDREHEDALAAIRSIDLDEKDGQEED